MKAASYPSLPGRQGYGAFSIGMGPSGEHLQVYISGQAEHHRKRDFQTEFLAFLKEHRIEYDPRYIWK
jgi:putative transposase